METRNGLDFLKAKGFSQTVVNSPKKKSSEQLDFRVCYLS